MAGSDSRGAVIALVGGVLGALIGGGTSFASSLISNEASQLQFTYGQERNAYVQVATTSDAYRQAAAKLVVAAGAQDEKAFTTAETESAATFLRFGQAYNEAFFVLQDVGPLGELYEAGRMLDDDEGFADFDAEAKATLIDAFDRRSIAFIESAREQVRARLSSAG